MTEKVRLGEGEIKGGFIEEGKTQKYQINYLPKVFENSQLKYGDKVELAILTPGNDPEKTFFHSLRFVSPDQMKVVILKLIDAHAYFMNKKDMLNIHNAKTLPHVWAKEIGDRIHKMAKEKQLRLGDV